MTDGRFGSHAEERALYARVVEWPVDDRAKRFHLAFLADPPLLEKLQQRLDEAAGEARTRALAAIRAEAPEGWRAAEDGTFVPLDEAAFADELLPLDELADALADFHDAHVADYERRYWAESEEPSPAAIAELVERLERFPFAADERALLRTLSEHRGPLPRAAWRTLTTSDRLDELIARDFPEPIIRAQLGRLLDAIRSIAERDERGVEALVDRTPARERFDHDGFLDAHELLCACLELCTAPFAPSIGVGPGGEDLPMPERTLLSWRAGEFVAMPSSIDGWVCWGAGDQLSALAGELRAVADAIETEPYDPIPGESEAVCDAFDPREIARRTRAHADACEQGQQSGQAVLAFIGENHAV